MKVTRPRDFLYLLALDIVVNAFVAYEMAGLTLPGWHTISWYAAGDTPLGHALDWAVMALFFVGGNGGLLWWWKHRRSAIYR